MEFTFLSRGLLTEKALIKLSRSFRSAVTTSTPRSLSAMALDEEVLRVIARTEYPASRKELTIEPPWPPVAPITAIVFEAMMFYLSELLLLFQKSLENEVEE